MKINVSKNKAWPRPASASKRNSEGASSGRGVTLETLTDGQRSGKSGKNGKRSHQHSHGGSGASGGRTPGPRWKGPAKQSLRLAAVEFDAVGVPVEMVRVGLVEWLEERIVGALVGNHGVVAMAREDCHVAGNAHELIHQ